MDLEQHIENGHEGANYKCDKCKRNLGKQEELLHHKINFHEELSSPNAKRRKMKIRKVVKDKDDVKIWKWMILI